MLSVGQTFEWAFIFYERSYYHDNASKKTRRPLPALIEVILRSWGIWIWIHYKLHFIMAEERLREEAETVASFSAI